MIRVVLDTNIIVSSLLNPLGAPARVLSLAIGDAIQLCISGKIYGEYEEVISAALDRIRRKSLWVRPAITIRACSDPDDDMFLECADAARSGYVVTGNTKDFPDFWNQIKVVTARGFLERR